MYIVTIRTTDGREHVVTVSTHYILTAINSAISQTEHMGYSRNDFVSIHAVVI